MRKWIATVIRLALLVGGTAQAQTSKDVYPNRPVRMIVPFGAGGRLASVGFKAERPVGPHDGLMRRNLSAEIRPASPSMKGAVALHCLDL